MTTSLLSGKQRILYGTVLVLATVLVANAAYLFTVRAAGWAGLIESPDLLIPPFYQGMILSHTAVGLLLVLPLTAFVAWHLKSLWQLLGNRAAKISGLALVGVCVLITVTGLFILSEANSKEHRWALWLHVVCAAVIPLFFLKHRKSVSNRISPAVRNRGAAVFAAVFALFLGNHLLGVVGGEEGGSMVDQGLAQVLADPYPSELMPAAERIDGDIPPDHRFFPSALQTITGRHLPEAVITRYEYPDPQVLAEDLQSHGFLHRQEVGTAQCIRCHPDSVEQWRHSAHRFSSFNNPFYRKTVELLRDEIGTEISQWCGGCHDPALMPTGVMAGEVDPEHPAAQAGLTCLACHGIEGVVDNTGNANFIIQDETVSPYLFYEAEDGTLGALLHDVLVKARPDAHRRAMKPDLMSTSEYCATCHKVSLQAPVNSYRWLRGQNEYDNWHDSGVARNATRTFYLPPKARVCQDCHMPAEEAPQGDVAADGGTIRSHRFLAVNSALPHLRGDTDTIRRMEQFLEGKLRVDLFAMRVKASGTDEDPEAGEAPLYTALDLSRPTLPAGAEIELLTVVRNQGVGHTFPGGTNDSNEGWLHLDVTTSDGRTLLLSGELDEGGHVDEAAHFYKIVAVNSRGERIDKRDAQNIHTTAWGRVIGPGTADLARYRFRLPEDLSGGEISLTVRLKWRKFRQAYTDFVFGEGARTDFPITLLAEDRLTLAVGPAEGAANPTDGEASTATDRAASAGAEGRAPTADDWVRFNDFGIAALLQGDTRLAAIGFSKVNELVPEQVDGPRNLARIAILNGDLESAFTHLRTCEERVPADPQSAWFWGMALLEDGRYPEAAEAFAAVLKRFPEDRAAHRQLGRTLYLDQQHEASIAAFRKVLDIDPEDRVAWYHLMLNARALGDEELAALAETRYERFSIDESGKEATLTYLAANPNDNREAQKIHYHE